jgi:hypothetical protein
MFCFGALIPWALFPHFFTFHGLILIHLVFRYLWRQLDEVDEEKKKNFFLFSLSKSDLFSDLLWKQFVCLPNNCAPCMHTFMIPAKLKEQQRLDLETQLCSGTGRVRSKAWDRFLKYFRRKNLQKYWRFLLKLPRVFG